MDVLLTFFLCVLSASAWASPPVDLSDFDGKDSAERVVKGKPKVDPGISEKQMIYLDNQDGMDSTDPGLRQVKHRVLGRDRPGREGKVLMQLRENQRVKALRTSKDKRWTLVEIPSLKKKAWIPSVALVEL